MNKVLCRHKRILFNVTYWIFRLCQRFYGQEGPFKRNSHQQCISKKESILKPTRLSSKLCSEARMAEILKYSTEWLNSENEK